MYRNWFYKNVLNIHSSGFLVLHSYTEAFDDEDLLGDHEPGVGYSTVIKLI